MSSGLFPNAGHVAWREYVVRVRARAYILSTALILLAIVGFTLFPTLLRAVGVQPEPARIGLDVRAQDLPADPVTTFQLALLSVGDSGDADERPSVRLVDDAQEARGAVRAGDLDGVLTITRAADGELEFQYYTDASPANPTHQVVTQAAAAFAITDRLERAGISESEALALLTPPTIAVTSTGDGTPATTGGFASQSAAFLVVVLTFMAIIVYGNWVAQSVAEEKSNRVMELLITAATPRQLLAGKVLGTAAAGLTQYVAVLATAVAATLAAPAIGNLLGVSGDPILGLPAVDPWMLPIFAAFFLLGFLLYSTLYAAAGSLVSRVEDVQQATGVLMFLAVAGYFVSFAAIGDPAADWVAVLSVVPFFAPYLMPARMLLTAVDPTAVAAAFVLLAATLLPAVWVASRIYSAGVLMYGQRPGVRSLLRAARVSR